MEEEKGVNREVGRWGGRREGARLNLTELGFVCHVVPVPMTSALWVTPGPVIVPPSSLVSEVREGDGVTQQNHVPGWLYQPLEGRRTPNASKSTAGAMGRAMKHRLDPQLW